MHSLCLWTVIATTCALTCTHTVAISWPSPDQLGLFAAFEPSQTCIWVTNWVIGQVVSSSQWILLAGIPVVANAYPLVATDLAMFFGAVRSLLLALHDRIHTDASYHIRQPRVPRKVIIFYLLDLRNVRGHVVHYTCCDSILVSIRSSFSFSSGMEDCLWSCVLSQAYDLRKFVEYEDMLLVFIARKWMLPNGIAGTYQPRAWSRRLNLLQALFLAHRFDRSLARACFCSPSVRSSDRNRAESRYDRDDAGGNENHAIRGRFHGCGQALSSFFCALPSLCDLSILFVSPIPMWKLSPILGQSQYRHQ